MFLYNGLINQLIITMLHNLLIINISTMIYLSCRYWNIRNYTLNLATVIALDIRCLIFILLLQFISCFFFIFNSSQILSLLLILLSLVACSIFLPWNNGT